MALYANVPFALAPGMGANAFFTFVLCKQMGFSWCEALAIVFICGLFVTVITVTKVRKAIIIAIPNFLKDSITAGIGMFIAYIGFKNASFLTFLSDAGRYNMLENGNIITDSSAIPTLSIFNNPNSLLGLIGLIVTVILIIKKVKGAIFIGIVCSILIGIPMNIVDISKVRIFDLSAIFSIKDVAFTIFNRDGISSLFTDWNKMILTITAVLALLLSITFDAVGAFIGAGRVSGIFDAGDKKKLSRKKGLSSKFEKALFSDGVASVLCGLLGTSSITTYVESASGISVGGRTGLTSLVVTIMFLLCLPFSNLFRIVPPEATAPTLIVVGVLMMTSIRKIDWTNYEQAFPSFLTITIMSFAFNISYGIAAGFIFYCIIKLIRCKAKEIHPVLAGASLLFLINFIITAIRG
jgi:AGZA family xanthine/uracil permease-like MFS transporter